MQLSRERNYTWQNRNHFHRVVLIVFFIYMLNMLLLWLFSGFISEKEFPCVHFEHPRPCYIHSELHETTVPLTALYSDNEGECIFEIVSREGLYGTRYYLRRIQIEIICVGVDEKRAAINAAVSREMQILSDVLKDAEDGKSVRIK